MVMSDAEFITWCSELELTEKTRTIIAQIRNSEPVRRVGSRAGNNVCGRYPSAKMGKTIQFESHKIELPAIVAYEADDDVLEYYDQPFELKLSFVSQAGRKVSCKHVPDFLVLRRAGVTFEEWKPEKQLLKLAEKQPTHYHQDADGQWHNPPAHKTAESYGIPYWLKLDRDINWCEFRNRQFLKSYRDGRYSLDDELQAAILLAVATTPGITLHQLLQTVSQASPDDAYALISTGILYIDCQAASLIEPRKVNLFRDRVTAEAFQLTSVSSALPIAAVEMTPGQEQHPAQTSELFLKASPEALCTANHRFRILKPYLQGNPPAAQEVSQRTLRRWKQLYKAAQHQHGWGYVGLLPRHHDKGNRIPKLSPDALEFIDQVVEQHYETLQQKGKFTVYGILLREWDKAQRSDSCPSHVTFYDNLTRRNQHRQTQKRQGSKAAYQKSAFHWELELTTPRHGDRPLEIAHIDHTELDIELVCSRTGEGLGRPWATVLLDAFSRRVLALYLSFDPPSYRACMMALRICVHRQQRFPETIVMDRGCEFDSVYFETLLATFNCTKKQRPPARPRFGSILERFFGTTNTEFLYSLQGNTQLTKNIRQVTRKNSPRSQAVWSLDKLYNQLCQYVYTIYDQNSHPALGQSPQAAFVQGFAQTGMRPQRKVVNDSVFEVLTLPSTPKGTAKVKASQGIRVNYLDYWAIDDSFLHPEVEGTEVPIRYDPFDVSIAYAYIQGQWVRCISQYHSLFQGRSEREIKVISAELRRQKQQHNQQLPMRAKTIASYLESAEISEAVQRQRLKDLAAKDLHQQIQFQTQEKEAQGKTSNTPLATTEPLTSHSTPPASFTIDLTQVTPYRNEELWT